MSRASECESTDLPAIPLLPEKPALSIVIVSYRRYDELLLCLDDLAEQVTRFRFEVVLVLQAYDEGTPERITLAYSGRLCLRSLVFDHGLGVHGARNVALSHVRSDIIAFVDDDVRLPPDWVDTLIPFYDDPLIGGVGGFVRHPGCERLVARFLRPALGLSSRRYRIDWGGFHTMPWSSHPTTDQPADWLSGCNMSFRRSLLGEVGGFDESYGNYGFDDVDIALRVRRTGAHLLSSQRLEVQHYPSIVNRPDLPDLIREEEARRIILIRRAIGHLRFWRARYVLRFIVHLTALFLQGLSRGRPGVVFSAIAGARQGLAQHGKASA